METSTVKIIPMPDNKFEIISFCYTVMEEFFYIKNGGLLRQG